MAFIHTDRCVFGNMVAAATVGDDGLHIQPWIRDTFKDLQEDLDEANAEGKRLAIFFEQRGCIYCTKMHESVYLIQSCRLHRRKLFCDPT